MTDFGEKLRGQRESSGLTLDEICESTKIRKVYLQALEANDFAALPGGVFTKGYIRSYAQALGIHAESLLEEYEDERTARGFGTAEEDDRAAQDAAQAALSRLAGAGPFAPEGARRWPLFVAIGLAVLLVAAGAAWWMLRDRETEQPKVADAEPVVAEPVVAESVVAESVVAESVAAPPETEQPKAPVVEPVVPEPVAAEPEIVEPAKEEPPPVARKAPEPPPVETGLRITESGVGSGISDRQLVGQADRFDEGSRVWFWNRVLDGKPGDSIRHVWIREGKEVGATQLNIGGSHWRTQSNRTLAEGSAGSWVVEARDGQGRVLARAAFVCVKP